MKPPVFLSAGIGAWYPRGVDRLKASLSEHRWPGDVIAWKDEWPDQAWPNDCVYNVKPAAFSHAIAQGYRTIIWGDASVYAVDDMARFLDVLRHKGMWLASSGYNAAQTATDAQLEYFGVTRDEAERMPDTATGLFGVNLDYDYARHFIEEWIRAGRNGAFKSDRRHAGQSRDSRFLFGRQDQSCASLIAGKMGLTLDVWSDFVSFRWDAYPCTFRCEGMG